VRNIRGNDPVTCFDRFQVLSARFLILLSPAIHLLTRLFCPFQRKSFALFGTLACTFLNEAFG
jgi:hypothetical protein